MPPLSVPDAIRQRRSIKTFTSEPIAAELLHELIELTLAAPSSYNLQQWRIVIVQDPAQKEALSVACYHQKQIVQAPATFVFATAPRAWEADLETVITMAVDQGAWPEAAGDLFREMVPQFQNGLGNQEREYAIKDAMIAATHMTLAAESLGLSTCMMNGWVEDKVKAVIGAGDDLAIALVIPVGYAAEPRVNPGRLPVDHLVFGDRVGQPL